MVNSLFTSHVKIEIGKKFILFRQRWKQDENDTHAECKFKISSKMLSNVWIIIHIPT